jgi:DtxR family transcriptional regulator, Mn-dependent transcriptional regulator
METLSSAEENYLKALYHLSLETSGKSGVGTNELASYLVLKPATVNDMLKKLREKKLVNYEKYGKIKLTAAATKLALGVIRRHRLWETFLYEKLEFTWDEVHEVAEQLEHIRSEKLIEKLDKFLNYPRFDPHGDAIPNAKGEIEQLLRRTLADAKPGESCRIVAVRDGSATFLQYVMKVGLGLSSSIKVISRQDFDGSMEIEVKRKRSVVSQKFAENVFVI